MKDYIIKVRDCLQTAVEIINETTVDNFIEKRSILSATINNVIDIVDRIDHFEHDDNNTLQLLGKIKRNMLVIDVLMKRINDIDDEICNNYKAKIFTWITYYIQKINEVLIDLYEENLNEEIENHLKLSSK